MMKVMPGFSVFLTAVWFGISLPALAESADC